MMITLAGWKKQLSLTFQNNIVFRRKKLYISCRILSYFIFQQREIDIFWSGKHM